MKDLGNVQGGAEQAKPLIVGFDTVYVHTDIKPVEDMEGMYEYNEIQYDKDEYIQLMAQQNISLEQQVTDTQIAMIELFEGVI